MHRRILSLTILLTILCLSPSWIGTVAQTVNIKNTDGLNGEHVNKIFKDSRGLIWVGTNQGLTAYNGSSLINFQMGEPPQTISVNDIAELSDHTLLAATDKGLFRADFAQLTCRPICTQIKDASSLACLDGRLYIGTSAGLYEYRSETQVQQFFLEKDVISGGNAIYDLCPDDDTHLWICAARQIIRFDTHSHHMQRVSLSSDIHMGTASAIAKVDAKVFIGTTSNGLLCYDTSRHTLAPYAIAPVTYVRDLHGGPDGTLYVSGNEPYKLDVRHNRVLAVYGRQHNDASGMQLPSDGSYTYWNDAHLDVSWFGFFLEGFSHNYHSRPLLHIFKYRDFDSSQLQVRSFCIHADDILIGTRMGFYHINKHRQLVRYYSPAELDASVVTDITWFSDRFVLTTYERGMRIYNPETMHLTVPQGDEGLAAGNFSQLAVTPDGQQLFAASNLGLFVFNNHWQYVHNYNYRNSKLPDSYIPSIFFDRQGKAWIGTMQQLCIYDPSADVIMEKGFPDGFFHAEPMLSFNQASDGDVIAFTGSKVYKSRTDLSHFTAYSLPCCGVINFLFPFAGQYLIGSNMGLFYGKLDDAASFRQFTEADGLPSLGFNKQEVLQTPDGTLWMANSKGLVYLTADGLNHLTDPLPGKVMLDFLGIDDRNQGHSALLQLIDNPAIKLTWNFVTDKLTFVPLLLDYAKRTGRYYEYNLDAGPFQTTLDGRNVDIMGLSLGKHHLTVRLAGHPETATTYTLTVLPAPLFYFEMLFALTLLITLWALLRLHRRSKHHRTLLRQKHRLEQEISAQSAVRQLLEQQENQRLAHEQAQVEMRQQRTSTREYKELQRRVKEYMELERPYRNVKFRLSDLAKAVDSTPTMISLMLNQLSGTNFYDFVNRYRLEEFKRRSREDRYADLPAITLAEQCGFKKTTFFAAFKKFEGCTPGEWAEGRGKKADMP